MKDANKTKQQLADELTQMRRRVAELESADQDRVREITLFPQLNPGPVLRFNLNGQVVSANPAAEDLLGAEARQGTPLVSLIPGISDVDLVSCIEEGQIALREIQVGCRFFLLTIRGVPEYKVGHIYGSDVTQRKGAEEELGRLAAIVASSDDAILGMSLDGIITSWNTAAERIYGYSAKEVIGGPVSVLVPSDLPDEVPSILAAIRRGEHVKNFETVRRKKEGILVNVALTISPVMAGGEIIGASTIATDITERMEEEAAERRRSEEMATLYSVANILAQSGDLEDNITEALASLVQITSADHVALWIPDEKEQVLKILAEAGPAAEAAAPQVLSYTDSVSGRAFHLGEPVIEGDYPSHPLASAFAINRGVKSVISLPVSAGGHTIGLVIIFSRVPDFFTADRVRFLIAVVGGMGTLLQNARLHKSLDEHANELARSNAELEQFAYVASHDLQEPLRMVSSYMQLISQRYKDKLDSDGVDFIGYAVDGATRMQALIQDLLSYSHVGTQGKPFEPANCNYIVDQVIADLDSVIGDSGASVTRDDLPVVMGDTAQLGQLMQNLVSNGIKFRGKAPPQIRVSKENRGNEWVFSVRDNGIGIEPQHYERIFLMFQRLHHRSDYPGTGIGLALCQKIVDRHGGRIWVESEPGKGSAFHFTIPAGE